RLLLKLTISEVKKVVTPGLVRIVCCGLVIGLLSATAWSQQGYYLQVPQAPKIPARTFKLTDYGGVGDGKTMNTEAFAKAIDACKKAGGGSVVVPPGTYLTGPIKIGRAHV